MPNLEYIRLITDYNYALFDKVWDSVMQLSEEQFSQHIDYSHGSVRNQMVHTAQTEGGWYRGMKDDPNARQFDLGLGDDATREQVRDAWYATTGEVRSHVESLDEDALLYTPQQFMGPVWHAVVHLVNHGTDHRAQLLRILHDFGAPTFDQDMVFYIWNP